jgi:hypothetical protein
VWAGAYPPHDRLRDAPMGDRGGEDNFNGRRARVGGVVPEGVCMQADIPLRGTGGGQANLSYTPAAPRACSRTGAPDHDERRWPALFDSESPGPSSVATSGRVGGEVLERCPRPAPSLVLTGSLETFPLAFFRTSQKAGSLRQMNYGHRGRRARLAPAPARQ